MRSKEQGSVVGFVIGGVLLLALLVGGIVLYKNNISKMIGIKANDSQVATTTDTSNKTDETKTDNQAAQNEAALKQQQEAEKKAQEQNKAANSTPVATTPNPVQVPHTATAPSQALPKTGPTENAIMAAVGMSLVIGSANAYYRSRAAL